MLCIPAIKIVKFQVRCAFLLQHICFCGSYYEEEEQWYNGSELG